MQVAGGIYIKFTIHAFIRSFPILYESHHLLLSWVECLLFISLSKPYQDPSFHFVYILFLSQTLLHVHSSIQIIMLYWLHLKESDIQCSQLQLRLFPQ